MINHILKNLIFKKRLKILDRKKKLYQISRSIDEIYEYQIDHFNKIWQKTIAEIPFYQYWKKKYDLPNFIKNLDELKYFPSLEKKHLQENEDLIFLSSKNYTSISTGGSTGKPIRLPVSKIELLNSYANQYLGRSWWNIKPLDRIIFCWGHSHLFGNGIHGKINQYKRFLYDFIINTKRLNAYDMSLGSIDKYCQIIKKSNPVMIIGYTSSIYRIAKYIDENNFDINNNSDLKAVVVTSETVTNYDINLIEKIFNTTCVIEYGMAETGVIAYSSKENSENLDLFWDTFIGIKNDKNILNITTINDRIFPLINYSTDDLIESNDSNSILKIKKIIGRKNDFIKIKVRNNIIECHSEFFTHILKSIKNIENFKIIQKKNLDIEIEYVSLYNFNFSKIFLNEISKEFNGVNKNTFTFRRVKDIQKTIAGKSKWIEVEK